MGNHPVPCRIMRDDRIVRFLSFTATNIFKTKYFNRALIDRKLITILLAFLIVEVYIVSLQVKLFIAPQGGCRGGEIGRRSGLKIRRGSPHAGSIPALGTCRLIFGRHFFF